MRIRGLLNGRQETGEWLCHTCSHAHIQKGYANAEQLVRCGFFSGDSLEALPFRVRECSSYPDQRRFDFRGRTGRAIGFVTPVESDEHGEDDTEVIPHEE
jgi:hypothetical protein